MLGVVKFNRVPIGSGSEAISSFLRSIHPPYLRRFLSMLNFYARFLPSQATVIEPLHRLLATATKPKVELPWDETLLQALSDAKVLLSSSSVTSFSMLLSTYWSTVLTKQLLQCSSNTVTATVGADLVFSHKLSPTEQRYSAFDRELLATYTYILYQLHLLSDHKALVLAFRIACDDPSPRQSRHMSFVVEFTTDIRYVSSSQNIPADCLSRISSYSL